MDELCLSLILRLMICHTGSPSPSQCTVLCFDTKQRDVALL